MKMVSGRDVIKETALSGVDSIEECYNCGCEENTDNMYWIGLEFYCHTCWLMMGCPDE